MAKIIEREGKIEIEGTDRIFRDVPGTALDVSSDEEAVFRFKLSDSTVALDGHTLATDGWDLSRECPVLWAHDNKNVSSVLGKWENFQQKGDDLYGDARFMPRSINPMAGTVVDMLRGGWLYACSVGFDPTKGKRATGAGRSGFDFSEQTLLEASIVPVGSLSTALISARNAGTNVEPMRAWARAIMETDMPKVMKRDLCDVSWLAQLLKQLSYIEESVEYEAEAEGDNSPVPAMLTDALKQLGAALIAMTTEEVNELLGEEVSDERAEDSKLVRAFKKMGRSRSVVGTSLAVSAETRSLDDIVQKAVDSAFTRAGRVLSSDNERCLRDAHGMIRQGADAVEGLLSQVAVAPEPEVINTEDKDDAERRAAVALRTRKAKMLQVQALVR